MLQLAPIIENILSDRKKAGSDIKTNPASNSLLKILTNPTNSDLTISQPS